MCQTSQVTDAVYSLSLSLAPSLPLSLLVASGVWWGWREGKYRWEWREADKEGKENKHKLDIRPLTRSSLEHSLSRLGLNMDWPGSLWKLLSRYSSTSFAFAAVACCAVLTDIAVTRGIL